MRQVSWGDVIFSVVLTAVFLVSAAVVTFAALQVLDYPDSILGIDVIYLVVFAVGLVVSLLALRAYPGPMSDFGPWWAWLAFIAAVPAIGSVGLLVTGMGFDSLVDLLSMWLLQLSVLATAIVLSIYLSGRDSTMTIGEARAKDF